MTTNDILHLIKHSNLQSTTKSFFFSILKGKKSGAAEDIVADDESQSVIETGDQLLSGVQSDPNAAEARKLAQQQMKLEETTTPVTPVAEVSTYDPSVALPTTKEEAHQWLAYYKELTGMEPHPNALNRILNRNKPATKRG